MGRPVAHDFTEALVSELPVTVKRRVRWQDCDPAQVVYTGRFFDYAASAMFWFFQVVLARQNIDLTARGLGTPMKALSFEFLGTLHPNEYFTMEVELLEIRQRTFDAMIHARRDDGSDSFRAKLSPILIQTSEFKSVVFPKDVRAAFEAYKSNCGRTKTSVDM